VTPKDLALHIIATLGASAGVGHAVEFAGPAIEAMPIEGRLTLCNLAVELGAKFAMVAPDDATFDYLRGRPFAPKGELFERAVETGGPWPATRTPCSIEKNTSLPKPCVR
jgi:3-isopropylmalate/(R)-2-methylmalate dehydratase large subunit